MLNMMRFRVYTTTPAGTPAAELVPHHDLVILPADRMRAERASTAELAPAQRGPGAAKAHPETWLLLWLWCAATRTGVTADKFTTWAESVLDYDRLTPEGEPVTDDDELEPDELLEPVDPTRPGASTS